jgi:hypothetical protein
MNKKILAFVLLSLFMISSCGSKEPFRMNMMGPTIAMPMVPGYLRGPLQTNLYEGPVAFDVPQPTTLSTGMQIPEGALLEGYYRAHGNRVYFAPAFISFKDTNGQTQRIQLSSQQTGMMDLRTDAFKYGEQAGKGAAVGAVGGTIIGALGAGWQGALIGAGVGAGAGAASGALGEWFNNNNTKTIPAQTGMMLDFRNK